MHSGCGATVKPQTTESLPNLAPPLPSPLLPPPSSPFPRPTQPPPPPGVSVQGCRTHRCTRVVFTCASPDSGGKAGRDSGAARRRRERRLRSAWRQEQLAAASHRSAQQNGAPRSQTTATRAREGHEKYEAPRPGFHGVGGPVFFAHSIPVIFASGGFGADFTNNSLLA